MRLLFASQCNSVVYSADSYKLHAFVWFLNVFPYRLVDLVTVVAGKWV